LLQLGVLTQEEAFVKARQLVELHKSDNSEALASLLQELETQCEEARLHPVVRVVKSVLGVSPCRCESLSHHVTPCHTTRHR
jgi:hypothetical protein